MYEGPKLYGEDTDEEFQQEPFDYLEHAKKLREERDAIGAQKKAERTAKEATEKTEKEARLAKKLADKATKNKADQLAKKTENAKAVTTVEKAEVEELKSTVHEASRAVYDGLPAPVEMAFTNGSEYTANLEVGEEAIFELSHSAEKAENTIALADEVQHQADALARARAAIESVNADHMGASYEGQEVNPAVFGVMGPQDDIRDRLKHTWEMPVHEELASNTLVEAVMVPEISAKNVAEDSLSLDTEVGPSKIVTPANKLTSQAAGKGEVFGTQNHAANTLKDTAAYVSSFITRRASSTNNKLEQANSSLSSELDDDAQSESEQTVRSVPFATPESPVMSQANTDAEKSPPADDNRVTNERAIPEWITRFESDVNTGKRSELKKWQRDVLRVQHPDLLRRYEALEGDHREQIIGQSKETIRGLDNIFAQVPTASASPGDLPAPVYPLPAYMKPNTEVATQKPPSVPAFEYASPSTLSTESPLFNNQYLVVVIVGGLFFGVALIAVFGF